MIKRLFKLSISVSFYIVYKIIVTILSLLNKKPPGIAICLNYHSVNQKNCSRFNAQMDEVMKTGIPIFADFNQPLPNGVHYIAVTFDDGFQNILKNALPAMRERNIPATIFITTGYMGKKPVWITDPKHPNRNELLMTEDHLKNLPVEHVTIGSHTVNHPHLAKVDVQTIERELTDSKKKLEDLLKRKVTLLSLPYGSIDMRNIECFKQAGYERVFLNIPTFPATLTGHYFVGRINASPDDWMIEYKLKLKGAYHWHLGPLLLREK